MVHGDTDTWWHWHMVTGDRWHGDRSWESAYSRISRHQHQAFSINANPKKVKDNLALKLWNWFLLSWNSLSTKFGYSDWVSRLLRISRPLSQASPMCWKSGNTLCLAKREEWISNKKVERIGSHKLSICRVTRLSGVWRVLGAPTDLFQA